jgi:hypothetical protein
VLRALLQLAVVRRRSYGFEYDNGNDQESMVGAWSSMCRGIQDNPGWSTVATVESLVERAISRFDGRKLQASQERMFL